MDKFKEWLNEGMTPQQIDAAKNSMSKVSINGKQPQADPKREALEIVQMYMRGNPNMTIGMFSQMIKTGGLVRAAEPFFDFVRKNQMPESESLDYAVSVFKMGNNL